MQNVKILMEESDDEKSSSLSSEGYQPCTEDEESHAQIQKWSKEPDNLNIEAIKTNLNHQFSLKKKPFKKILKNIPKKQNNLQKVSFNELADPVTTESIKNEQKIKQKINTLQQEYEKKLLQKKIIALTFLSCGKLNFSTVNQAFAKYDQELKIDSGRFKSLIINFGTEIGRSLQRYIEVYCNMNVTPIGRSEMRTLPKIMANSKELLFIDIHSAFRDFLKFIYDLERVTLSPTSMVRLHRRLSELSREMSLYKQHIFQTAKPKQCKPREKLPIQTAKKQTKAPTEDEDSNQNSQNSELDELWDEDYEHFLIKCYKQTESFNEILQFFCQEFPDYQDLWTIQVLQQRFRNMVRRSFKNLIQKIQKMKLQVNPTWPDLVPITEPRMKMVIDDKRSRSIRFKILDFMTKNLKMGFKTLIEKINAFIESTESNKKRKKVQEDSDSDSDKDEQYTINNHHKKRQHYREKESQQLVNFTFVEESHESN